MGKGGGSGQHKAHKKKAENFKKRHPEGRKQFAKDKIIKKLEKRKIKRSKKTIKSK